MIRRYSRPRTFSPGWTPRPRSAVAARAGLTTMPSPPAAVRSSHHCGGLGALLGRREVDEPVPGRRDQRSPSSAAELLEVPGVRLGDRQRPALGREHLERRQGDAVEARRRVGSTPRRRRGTPRRCAPARSVRAARSADVEAASRGRSRSRPARAGTRRAAAPTEAYWSRIRPMALADQGSSSQSSTSQSVSSASNSGAAAARSPRRPARLAVSSKKGRPVRV